MKKWKRFLIVFLALGVVSIGTLSWYAAHFSMQPVTGYDVNSDTLRTRVLIATQGSAFKDGVVTKVIDSLKSESLYFKVIDVAFLPSVSERDWDAIIILHTWEYSKPPATVKDFIYGAGTRDKILVVTTSGSGSMMEDVDGISSASKQSEQENVVRAIVRKIESKKK
jgi:hypothetical protein